MTPMIEIDESTAAAYARDRGLFPESSAVRSEWLSGGVSNAVFLLTVRDSGERLILKQAREKLRTAAEWRSRLDRIWREVAALRVLGSLVPRGEVPEVLLVDRDNYLFAMTAVPAGHVVWKQVLLARESRPDVYAKLGSFLGRVHAGTWSGAGVPPELHDKDVFDELRLDPYYRWTARRHPAVEVELLQLVESTAARQDCLTLADFSPKNILLFEDRLTVLDFETAHLGDPAFDLGFFTTHLVLKAVHLPATRDAIFAGVRGFLAAYRREFSDERTAKEIDDRSQRHLAACLLARVDGKSPVDYLSLPEQAFVRGLAISLVKSPAADWIDLESRLRCAISNSRF
ncbi:MAG TPA: phosphotransferase [Caulifigura sp.]|nr:phosphotransferase [Caulifigura sp.]